MNQTFKQYYKSIFLGKKITKQGFGILGRGGGVTKFLISMGADILVTDMKERENFEEQIQEVENYLKEQNEIRKEKGERESKIEYVFGEHRIEDFVNCDFVIQASGVPKDNIYLAAARKAGKIVYQEGSLFCKIVNDYFGPLSLSTGSSPSKIQGEQNALPDKDRVTIIGVTGTRGKTTTTFLIKHILDENFKGSEIKVYLGGNVQGVATLELLKVIKAGDFVVMELDSWVLQGFKDIKFSPQISVFTTFMPDHMNYYHGDMKDYFLDKANIFSFQKENDVLISTENIKEEIHKYLDTEKTDSFFTNSLTKTFLSDDEIKKINIEYKSNLIGEHNKINLALAVNVCQKIGVAKNVIQKALGNFSGVAGRLEFVKEIKGVVYYNDTTSTTPDALMAALEALKEKVLEKRIKENVDSRILLISGGRDKELDISKMAEKIMEFKREKILREIVILNNETTTGSHKLLDLFKARDFKEENRDFEKASDLELCLIFVNVFAKNGDIVLFSPGFASFGIFKNEYDRGDKFNELVDDL